MLDLFGRSHIQNGLKSSLRSKKRYFNLSPRIFLPFIYSLSTISTSRSTLYASYLPNTNHNPRPYQQVFTSTILQQVFQVEYLVQNTQCLDCARLAAKNTWKALVQVRQKVPHKRTFLFLEQLILKHGAQKETISVKEVKDGLDFFYSQRSHAIRMVEFLAGVVPVK